jgi:hypothetical protein
MNSELRTLLSEEVAMDTLSRKCKDVNKVASFCGCIAGEESVDPAAKSFCNRAKTDKNITGEDLAELKKALTDLEDDDCCGC